MNKLMLCVQNKIMVKLQKKQSTRQYVSYVNVRESC